LTIQEIQAELQRLLETREVQPPAGEAEGRPASPSSLRTSVMTHIAWVPQPWRAAAEATLAGLGEAHPSRTIVLFPQPDAPEGELAATVELYCFPAQEDRRVFSEVVTITLPGSKSHIPASIVTPLLRSDLPVFLRWRGAPPFGAAELVQLVEIADRLIVDSREWPEPELGYEQLPALFEEVAASDIAWSRLDTWREAIARLWPAVERAKRLRVRSPRAEALLLSRWLAARLDRRVELVHELAAEIESAEVDGLEALPARRDARSPSELLSDQLEVFGRDAVYEQTVRTFSRHVS
jgi:hypothetical protein